MYKTVFVIRTRNKKQIFSKDPSPCPPCSFFFVNFKCSLSFSIHHLPHVVATVEKLNFYFQQRKLFVYFSSFSYLRKGSEEEESENSRLKVREEKIIKIVCLAGGRSPLSEQKGKEMRI